MARTGWLAAFALIALVAGTPAVAGPPVARAPEASAIDSSTFNSSSGNPAPTDASGAADSSSPPSIALNPGTAPNVVGTGQLGQWCGLPKDGALRIGGVWVGDETSVLAGGVQPGHWTPNNLVILDASLDGEKLCGWHGASFDAEYLMHAGIPTNAPAGTVQYFDGLEALDPLDRNELYQLWWRQEYFDGHFITRVGKSAAIYDFGDVNRPANSTDATTVVPVVTTLIYTPVCINSSMLVRIPAYYDSAYGAMATWAPCKEVYFSYGCYDGNVARLDPTGLEGPHFNGYYFHIAEGGYAWLAGDQNKPGRLGVGMWRQTGQLVTPSQGMVEGQTGVYMFASQRLWLRDPGKDNSGVVGFVQAGANNNNSSLMRQYFGCGLTGYGLIPSRPKDITGFGLAWAFMNTDPNAGEFYDPGIPSASEAFRSNEVMLQWYDQIALTDYAFLQPTISYIPNPGRRPDITEALGFSLYLTVCF